MAETLVPRTDHTDNQGGTRLVRPESDDGDQSGAVNTTTLRNLVLFANTSTIIIKLDVEVRNIHLLYFNCSPMSSITNVCQGFECKVLSPYLSQPVAGVFLPFIFLEWMHIKLNLDNNCPDLEGLISQLSGAGYKPYDLLSKKKLLPSRFSPLSIFIKN